MLKIKNIGYIFFNLTINIIFKIFKINNNIKKYFYYI